MPLQLVRNDITKMKVDAIVNAANSSLLGGGGVDGAIHRAAGPRLLEECRTLGGCKTGQAKITGGYDLPAKYVIHTVGPVWNGGTHGEEALLAGCYRESMQLAAAHGCTSVAFPLISAGVYGYPKAQALRVAMDALSGFLLAHAELDMTVYLVLFGRDTALLGRALFPDLQEFIDDHYADEHTDSVYERARRQQLFSQSGALPEDQPDALPYGLSGMPAEPQTSAPSKKGSWLEKRRRKKDANALLTEEAAADGAVICHAAQAKPAAVPPAAKKDSLNDWVARLDESFQQMLLRKIDEAGITDVECYKRANLDRKLFSKIRSDVHYSPSKKTAVALAIALRLDMTETEDLLRKAGYALSRSNVFDVIIEYFISNRKYNIFEINEALFAFDQVTLG